MKYRLYFEDRQIGTVEQLKADFPNLSGTYELLSSLEMDEKLIWAYIQYSIEADILFESDEKKWEVFIEEESNFSELIDSEDWSLKDKSGETHKIMVPNFCDNNEIVWRWDFS